MDVWLVARGMGFGLAVAAPVGPMSLLCMRRTLATGWRPGLATGLGIAVGDGLYACVAAAGLTGLAGFMLAFQQPLHAAAGLVLIYLGLRTLMKRPAPDDSAVPVPESAARAFGSALLLTLTNPPTIITFAAIFASLAPPGGFAAASAVATVLGVFAGSALWWCAVVAGVATVRHALGARQRRWIDLAAGLTLAVFGAAELERAFM